MHTYNSIVNKAEPEVTFSVLKSGVKLAIYRPKKKGKAAISVSVNKGHFHTHTYPEGFAHLLEHMLFNSSNRYQKTNELDQHLAQFHGQTNGWTQDRYTQYQLNCDAQGILRACDILIDRLTQPCFALQDIENEITAIDAEFALKKHDPVRQLLSVQKATCSPSHPFSHFSSGNKATLQKLSTAHTQELLQQFHESVMQGKFICICLGLPENQITNDDIAALTAIIERGFLALNERFAQRGKKADNLVPINTPFYEREQLSSLIQITDHKKQHQLMISYVITQDPWPDNDVIFVLLTHLIESKHAHSLHDEMVSKGYIHNLYCHYKHLDHKTSELIIGINLSDFGAEHYLEVAYTAMRFVSFIQHKGIEKWRFREKASQFNLQANLQGKMGTLEKAITLCERMHLVDFSQCSATPQFNVHQAYAILPNILKQLSIDNTRTYFISPLAKGNLLSPHYEVAYSIQQVPKANFPDISYHFEKPRQNPFMVGDNKMVCNELSPTELFTKQSEQVNLKFYQDTSFKVPNGECYISITDPYMYASTQQMAIKRVWLACLNEYLAVRFFDVELASLHFRVYPHHHGISIHTSGLSERQLLLCIELINAVKAFKACPSAIKRHLAQCTNRLEVSLQQKPFNQLFVNLNEYYQNENKTNKTILKSLQGLSVTDVEASQQQFFAHNYVESLLIGNWQTLSISRFFKQLNGRFNALESVIKPEAPKHALQSGEHCHFDISNLDEENLIWHIVPCLDKHTASLTLAARSLILEKLLAPLSFEILRQRHKMGYMLGVGYKPIGGYPGIAIYLLSPTHKLSEIFAAMQEIVSAGIAELNAQGNTLEHLVSELIKQVSPKERELGQRATRAWLHFEDTEPLLAYQDLIAALKAISTQEIIACLNNMLNTRTGQLLMTQCAPGKKDSMDNTLFKGFVSIDMLE